MKERITWLDQLKGIGMLLVVLGHVSLPKETVSLIYSFHMPLFFMMSGMTLNDKKLLQTSVLATTADKGKKLVIPYLWMSFAMFPVWYLTYKIIGNNKTTIFQIFKGILYGNNVDYYSGTSNALWFLLALFFAYILYAVLVKTAKGNEGVMACGAVLIGILGYLDGETPQIWHFNAAFTAVVFMYIGRCVINLYKQNREWFESRTEKSKYLIIVLLYAIGYFTHRQNGRISMAINRFGASVLLFYISAIAFSLAIILTVIILPRTRLFDYVGKNTLLYVGLHVPVIRFFEKIYPEFKSGPKLALPLAIGVFLIMIPVCAVFNKFFPYVCAKVSVKEKGIIEYGKYLMAYICLIIPVYGVFQKFNLQLSPALTVLAVAIINVVPSVIFTIVAEKFFPFIYFQKEKQPQQPAQ